MIPSSIIERLLQRVAALEEKMAEKDKEIRDLRNDRSRQEKAIARLSRDVTEHKQQFNNERIGYRI